MNPLEPLQHPSLLKKDHEFIENPIRNSQNVRFHCTFIPHVLYAQKYRHSGHLHVGSTIITSAHICSGFVMESHIQPL